MSLKGVKPKAQSLVIGIGNPLRCDDGAGLLVADSVEAKGLSDVKVWITQQLNLEDLERMLEFDQVILVDASVDGPPLDFRPVENAGGRVLSSSHHLSAQTFVHLAGILYQKELKMRLCSIRGKCFDVGNKISPEVQNRSQEAVELICSIITKISTS